MKNQIRNGLFSSLFARSCRHRRISDRRFTLIELLVVVAMIAILASLLLPSLQKAKDKATRTVCMSHLKQTYLSLANYAGDNNFDLIPCGGYTSSCVGHVYANAWGNNGWIGIGRLYEQGYYPSLDMFFCPSSRNPYPDSACGQSFSSPTDPYWSLSLDDCFSDLSDVRQIKTGYCSFIRYKEETSQWIDPGKVRNNLSRHDPGRAILMDDFYSVGMGTINHQNGTNIVYLDGSVTFYPAKPFSYAACPDYSQYDR